MASLLHDYAAAVFPDEPDRADELAEALALGTIEAPPLDTMIALVHRRQQHEALHEELQRIELHQGGPADIQPVYPPRRRVVH